MKAIIQRVKKASVIVDHTTIGSIEKGVVALIGITRTDGKEQIE